MSIWTMENKSPFVSTSPVKYTYLEFPHLQKDLISNHSQTNSPPSSVTSELEEDNMMNLIPNLWSEETQPQGQPLAQNTLALPMSYSVSSPQSRNSAMSPSLLWGNAPRPPSPPVQTFAALPPPGHARQHNVSFAQNASNTQAVPSAPNAPNTPLTEENLSILLGIKPNTQPPIQSESRSQPHARSLNGASVNTNLYKTELCLQFQSKGFCPYGVKCQFAHGSEELKQVQRSSNWKTKPCVNWTKSGWCKYGRRCCFKHGEADV
ncbi:unnamed protein product [Kuraishia capsulata CBS 1993]|uniref:C3H1-type domain-containing protein n=1 Tax=Kuraishia capsulata CBS 1993 TaxID=1382522 RepID=W6MFX5_9ASCO|nr:uncharacterized protein KUCA_T00000278001 [Kuraishia capsulata CBS 1993]CDK24318.1 unnamed protein product [Kuraishia capsulata CBS 1993]